VILEEGLVDTYMTVNKNIENGAQWTFWSMRGNMKPKNKGWRLDYFLVSPELLSSVKDVQVRGSENFSDHVPLVITFG